VTLCAKRKAIYERKLMETLYELLDLNYHFDTFHFPFRYGNLGVFAGFWGY
jgi:hypothetical protein